MPDITGPIQKTTSGNAINSVYGAAVNNAILDPLQGFDADVWVIDQATGQYNLVGRFSSIQLTIRNATEPYLEMNQRTPRYLDGEIQIGWVLERGMLDTRVLQQTFGFSAISREQRIGRMPRFTIQAEFNAPELDKVRSFTDATRLSVGNGELNFSVGNSPGFGNRSAKGALRLTYCKIDNFTMQIAAGRSVIANKWEGLAEGIEEVITTNVWAGSTLTQQVDANTALAASGQAAALFGTDAGRPSGII